MTSIKRNLLRIVILVSSTILLYGCGTTTKIGHLPSNYKLDSSEKHGVVALSVKCNISRRAMSIFVGKYFREQPNKNHHIYEAEFYCNKPGDELGKSNILLMKLPVGVYVIYGWFQYRNMSTYSEIKKSRNFHALAFKVQPGRLGYLGQLRLIAGYNKRYTEQVINNAKEDIPKIRKKLPNLSEDKIFIYKATDNN